MDVKDSFKNSSDEEIGMLLDEPVTQMKKMLLMGKRISENIVPEDNTPEEELTNIIFFRNSAKNLLFDPEEFNDKEKAKKKAEKLYPGIEIVGVRNGFFGSAD